jgi:hypothetical protein
MLQRQEGRVWKGTYNLVYNHHTSYESLQESVKQNCGICRALHEEFETKVKVADAEVESEPQINETDGSNHSKGIVTVLGSAVWIVGSGALGLVRAVLSMLCFSALASSAQVSEIPKIPLTVEASLSVHKIEQLYHLDMTLHYGRRKPQLRVQRTFFLENPSKSITQEGSKGVDISMQSPETKPRSRAGRTIRRLKKSLLQQFSGWKDANARKRERASSTRHDYSASND